jgi:hypothetical protein
MNSQAANSRLEVPQDLGFGSVVTGQKHFRLLNRDGSFNVRRSRSRFPRLTYHGLLTMAWTRFVALFISVYLGVNILFACAYMLCGPDVLQGPINGDAFCVLSFSAWRRFRQLGTATSFRSALPQTCW